MILNEFLICRETCWMTCVTHTNMNVQFNRSAGWRKFIVYCFAFLSFEVRMIQVNHLYIRIKIMSLFNSWKNQRAMTSLPSCTACSFVREWTLSKLCLYVWASLHRHSRTYCVCIFCQNGRHAPSCLHSTALQEHFWKIPTWENMQKKKEGGNKKDMMVK